MNKSEWFDKPEIIGDKEKFIKDFLDFLKNHLKKDFEKINYPIHINLYTRFDKLSRFRIEFKTGDIQFKYNPVFYWINKQKIIFCSEMIKIRIFDNFTFCKRYLFLKEDISENFDFLHKKEYIQHRNFHTVWKIFSGCQISGYRRYMNS